MSIDTVLSHLQGVTKTGSGWTARCPGHDDKTASLPIIVLSAKTDAESVKRGLEVGATKYLTKPVSPNDLTRHVLEVLS